VRIRSIKPEFWRSQDIAELAWEDRLLFIGLWSYVDDNGVGRDDPRIITADLFALDSGEYRDTLARVADGLNTLAERGRIMRYTVEGAAYLEIVNWDRHQRIDRPNKARYPRSTDDSAKPRDTLATPSRGSSARNRGTGEQGNRGTDTSAPAARTRVDPAEFDTFWNAWPLKKGKKEARVAFEKAIKQGVTLERILAGVETYKREIGPSPDWSKVKWAQGWLNGARWEDEPSPTLPRRNVPKNDEWMYR